MPQFIEGDDRFAEGVPDFEQLLLEISSLFINLPVDSIDAVIEDTQQKICESLGLDLSALWQWSDSDNKLMTLTHLYTIPGGPDLPVGIDGSQAFPWKSTDNIPGQFHRIFILLFGSVLGDQVKYMGERLQRIFQH